MGSMAEAGKVREYSDRAKDLISSKPRRCYSLGLPRATAKQKSYSQIRSIIITDTGSVRRIGKIGYSLMLPMMSYSVHALTIRRRLGNDWHRLNPRKHQPAVKQKQYPCCTKHQCCVYEE